MNKAYNQINWENRPSDKTPLGKSILSKIDAAADEMDNRIIVLDTTKFDKTEAAKLIESIALDRATGIFTISYYNGATETIDTMLEKLAVNFDYDAQNQRLIITLDDGTIKYIDMSALITQYEFKDTDTVAFSVDSTGKVSAIVKEGSIGEKHLQPNYLADIKVEVAKAEKAAGNAAGSAVEAESWARGDTKTRPGEDTDNALYYYEQTKRISQGLQGALMPMGTITFAQLATVAAQAGYMYNISDSFVTDATFNEGAGHEYPAGTNVYLTADGKWDCMAGTAVGGVKGAKEATYRQGLVNITPENIGALPEDGDSAENTVTFESGDADAAEANVWTDVDALKSGEKHKSILKKISTMFKNIRYLYKMLGNTDISDHGGTVTQAIVWLSNSAYELEQAIDAQNDAFSKLKSDVSDLKPVQIIKGDGITGSIACYVKSNICYVCMEITPATVVNHGVIASGFPVPFGYSGLVALGTGNGNYTARMTETGVLEFYFPSFTAVERVDSSFCYLTSG